MPVVVAAMGAPIVVLAMESSDALLPFVVAAGVVVLPFLLFVSGCGSGGCVDVPSLPLLFVNIVGFVSTGIDGNVLMLFVFVVSCCGGGGYKDEDIGSYSIGGGSQTTINQKWWRKKWRRRQQRQSDNDNKGKDNDGGDGDSGDGGVPAQQATIS